MSTNDASSPRRRRPKKVLSPSAKYEIWLQLVRSEATINQAATSAGGAATERLAYHRDHRKN